MDPNEVLKKLREAFAFFDNAWDDDTRHYHACEARDAFEDLDAWLGRGGFLPSDWAPQNLHAVDL